MWAAVPEDEASVCGGEGWSAAHGGVRHTFDVKGMS